MAPEFYCVLPCRVSPLAALTWAMAGRLLKSALAAIKAVVFTKDLTMTEAVE